MNIKKIISGTIIAALWGYAALELYRVVALMRVITPVSKEMRSKRELKKSRAAIKRNIDEIDRCIKERNEIIDIESDEYKALGKKIEDLLDESEMLATDLCKKLNIPKPVFFEEPD